MLPLRRARAANGSALQVSVDFPDRQVHAAVWVAQVGRVPVLLLDTDLPANAGPDRPITHILYVRGREMRLCQELILGIGGVRALGELGIAPAVWHLNEGHSAFLLLERAREAMAEDTSLTAATALQQVGRDAVFTIHTPVAAGNETFDRGLVSKYLAPWLHVTDMEDTELLELGRGRTDDPNAPFDMTAFVLRHASHANAVSKLHAATATETWEDVAGHPIPAITNGVHVASWLGRPMRRLYERALGTFLASDHTGPSELERVGQIDDADLWAGHMQQKRELTDFIASRLARQFARHGEPPDQLREVARALDPKALTIGFARRFATYKRADLIFRDEERISPAAVRPRETGTDRHRRQGAPGGSARPGRDPAHLRAVTLRPAAQPGLHRRGLRHPDRPLPGGGRRHLAQQPAPAAGGVRHVGHEGRHERRAQRQRARRLVG